MGWMAGGPFVTPPMLNTLIAMALGASVGFQPSLSHPLYSPETGQVKLLTGVLSDPLAGELSQASLTWALSQRQTLGLPPTSTLRLGQAQGTWFGASFRLAQQIDGVDVHDAVVVVTIDAQRRVTIVSSSLLKYDQALLSWSIGSDEALARAAGAVPLAALQADGKPYGGWRFLPDRDMKLFEHR